MIRVPTSVEPVKNDLADRRVGDEALARRPSPCRAATVNTSSGRPASSASSASRRAVSGVSSAGLSTTVLPAASAGAKPQPAIGIGKFHGTIIPTTPSGSLERDVEPPATGICRPNSRSGAAE